MKNEKNHLYLTRDEWRICIESINLIRNRFIAEGRYTDAFDDLFITVSNAKVKKLKVIKNT